MVINLEQVLEIVREHFNSVTPREFFRNVFDNEVRLYQDQSTDGKRERIRARIQEMWGIDILVYIDNPERILEKYPKHRTT